MSKNYLLQGVCADIAEALRHKEAGTAAFRKRDLQQAALSYSGMTHTNEYVSCLVANDVNLNSFADCLNMLDETVTPGSAVASDAYCNRALVLLQQQPPDNQGALQDSACAIACNGVNCKASNGHVICICLHG